MDVECGTRTCWSRLTPSFRRDNGGDKMADVTVAELFEMAIGAEKAAEELYHGLAAKFAHHPEVADFWKEYAAEENGHAQWLERIRNGLSQDELAALADPTMLREARAALQVSVERALAQVHDLEDAYQLVGELENSETNAVFDFLITHFSSDAKTQAFLRAQLKEHIGRLMIDFPTRFRGAAMRRRVTAQG
ncbi:MAG: hypothetical protein DRI81_17420 [Chloroflexi bacterium]|nr:MAG: hypothetical protein DRI81_17420 [Chloroflexota bacterium]